MTHSQDLSVDVGNSSVDITVEYEYYPFVPERGPSYASGGEPAVSAHSELISMKVGDQKVPQWFLDAASDFIEGYLVDNHNP